MEKDEFELDISDSNNITKGEKVKKNLTVTDGLREIEILAAREQWQDKNDDAIWSDIWKTRGCFQSTSSEWNNTTMDEKIDLLKHLINKKGFDTLQLSLSMMEDGNSEFNKDIKEIDLIMSMSKIIDHLLKEKQ